MLGLEAKVLWFCIRSTLLVILHLLGYQRCKTIKNSWRLFYSWKVNINLVFVLAATATSFSGWTFMGHPGLIYRDGFPYAYASFYAITIPYWGTIFKETMDDRQEIWLTPGEMFSNYFRSDTIRILVVLVALVFSVPYLGIQLRASGFLFNVLTDQMFDVTTGMVLLSLVVILYVASEV